MTKEVNVVDAIELKPEQWQEKPVLLDELMSTMAPTNKGASFPEDLDSTGRMLWTDDHTIVGEQGIVVAPEVISFRAPDGTKTVLRDNRKEPGPPELVPSGRMRGQDAAWVQSTSTDYFQDDWKIYAWDGKDRESRLLADATKIFNTKGLPPTHFRTIPQFTADRTIYWDAVAPDKKDPDGYTFVIFSASIDGESAPRIVARKAVLGRVANDDLYYVKLKRYFLRPRQETFEIRRRTQTGVDSVVASGPLVKDQWIPNMAVSSTHLAWFVGSTDRKRTKMSACANDPDHGCAIYVKRHDQDTVTRIQARVKMADMTLDGDLLAWGSGPGYGEDNGQYVYNLDTGALWRLGESSCSMVRLALPYIWTGKVDAPRGECGYTISKFREPGP